MAVKIRSGEDCWGREKSRIAGEQNSIRFEAGGPLRSASSEASGSGVRIYPSLSTQTLRLGKAGESLTLESIS